MNINKHNYIVFLSFVFLLLNSCASLNPKAPEIVYETKKEVKQIPSIIEIPIQIDLKSAIKDADKAVPYDFTGEEQHCEGVSYAYKFKREPIQIEGFPSSDRKINFGLTIDGKYALSLNYCYKCSDLFTSKPTCVSGRIFASCGVGEPMREINVKYFTSVYLKNDYSLQSTTNLKEVNPKSPCEITVFKYDATAELVKEVKKALKDVGKEIDKEIEAIDLKKEISPIWNFIANPMDMSGYGYLNLKPQKIGIRDMNFKNNKLSFIAQLKAYPELNLENNEILNPKLPELSNINENNQQFTVALKVDAFYDSLSAIAMRELKNKEFQVKKNKIIIDSVRVYGASGNKIAFAVKISGSKKGTIFLDGTPSLDSDLQKLSFPDLSFHLETKNVLLKSAKWMLNGKITDLMKEKAILDLKPMLEPMVKMIEKELNGEIDKNLFMHTKISNLSVNNILPINNRLLLYLSIHGKTSIEIK